MAFGGGFAPAVLGPRDAVGHELNSGGGESSFDGAAFFKSIVSEGEYWIF